MKYKASINIQESILGSKNLSDVFRGYSRTVEKRGGGRGAFKYKVIATITEAKTKPKIYHVLRDANQVVLNCKRFSYIWPFTHSITQNTTHSNIMYLSRSYSPSTSLGKGEGVNEEINKKWHRKEGVQSRKWCPSHKFFYVLFFCNSSFIPSWFLMKPW